MVAPDAELAVRARWCRARPGARPRPRQGKVARSPSIHRRPRRPAREARWRRVPPGPARPSPRRPSPPGPATRLPIHVRFIECLPRRRRPTCRVPAFAPTYARRRRPGSEIREVPWRPFVWWEGGLRPRAAWAILVRMASMQIKGSVLKARLAFVQELEADGLEDVLKRLPEGDQLALRSLLATKWYPFDLGKRLDEAIVGRFGAGKLEFFEKDRRGLGPPEPHDRPPPLPARGRPSGLPGPGAHGVLLLLRPGAARLSEDGSPRGGAHDPRCRGVQRRRLRHRRGLAPGAPSRCAGRRAPGSWKRSAGPAAARSAATG